MTKSSQVNTIPESRLAQKKNIEKAYGIEKEIEEENCHSLVTGMQAANEEIMAEMRNVRKEQQVKEFQAKIKMAVTRRQQLADARTNQKNILHVSFTIRYKDDVQENHLRKVINDVVVAFYRPKAQVSRNLDDLDQSDQAPAPIRDLVNDKGPMGRKSVDFSKTTILSDKTNTTGPTQAKVLEIQQEIDYKNE